MNKLGIACLLSTFTMLQACNSDNSTQSSGGGSESTETTSFKISVDAPAQLLTAQQKSFSVGLITRAYAAAADNLDKDNFAVAVIGPDGNIIETVTLTSDNWSREADGTYNITLPGGERLDCVVLVSLDDGTPAVRLGEPLPQDVLLAPTTSEQLQVNLNSSVAYQAIINEIASVDGWGDYASAVGANPEDIASADLLVDELIANVAERVDSVVANLGTLNFDVSAVFASPEVKELASNIIDRVQTEKSAVTVNVSTALEQGFWWVYSDVDFSGDGEYTRLETGNITFDGETTSESMYEWLSSSDAAISLTNPTTSSQSIAAIDLAGLSVDEWVLAPSGDTTWLPIYDRLVFRSADESKAVFTDIGLTENTEFDYQLSLQEIDISGKKVASFLTFPEALAFLPLLPSDLKFGAGAKAYKLTENMVNEHTRYQLWSDTDCDTPLNNNCNRIYINGSETAPSELSELLSDAATDSDQVGNAKGAWLSGDLLAEMVNNNEKSLILWRRVAANSFKKTTSTWAQTTVNNVELYTLTIPEDLAKADNDIDNDERNVFFAVHDGFVRRGAIISSLEDDAELLFNQSAIETIYNNASIDNLPSFGRCSIGNKDSGATESDFIQAIAQCGYSDSTNYLGTFYNMNLVRVNSKGEVRGHQFLENNTLNYLKRGKINSTQYWTLNNGIIRISYGDDEPGNSYEMLAITAVDLTNSKYAFKIFTHDYIDEESGYVDEIWTYIATRSNPLNSLVVCETGDSQTTNDSEVPVSGTEGTQATYEQAVAGCLNIGEGEHTPQFTESTLQGNALQSISSPTEYMIFFDTDSNNNAKFEGQFRNTDANNPEVVNFEWSIVDGQLSIDASTEQVTITEISSITQTNGLEFDIKSFSQQSDWVVNVDYMTDGEGKIWSDAYKVVDNSTVPEVVLPAVE